MKQSYDCIIVGAGPAGIFAAFELMEQVPKARVLILEKGRPLRARRCPANIRSVECFRCSPCNITSGWGGAGAFSDGKLNIGREMTGWMHHYISQAKYEKYLDKTDGLWLKYGAPERVYGVNGHVKKLEREFKRAGFTPLMRPTRHMGSDNSQIILGKMYQDLSKLVEIRFGAEVRAIAVKKGIVEGVELVDGTKVRAKHVILAPGREGCKWFYKEMKRLELPMTHHPVELGVRVETKASVMKHLTDYLYEAKLYYQAPTFGDTVRTFCMCPEGQVVQECYSSFGNVISVNGHAADNHKTGNTNFALLVSTNFTKPFENPVAYGESITRLANLIGETVIVQRLGDLLAGRRSTPERIEKGRVKATLKSATPGDLAFCLPYRHLTSILEMIKRMDRVAPGIFSTNTLLYGVEVKFYSSAPKLVKDTLETQVKNLFAVGDGVGVTKNLVHACISGMVAGRAIADKLGERQRKNKK